MKEIRRDEPAIDTVEKGLQAAKAAGVPVDLEGPKPPASALAVTTTGFGPGSVAPKKPVPPTKPVPAVSPLGKAGSKAPPRRAEAARAARRAARRRRRRLPEAGAPRRRWVPRPWRADQLLQPPVAPTAARPEDDPAFTQVTGNVKGFAKDKKAHPPAASKAKEAQDAALAPTDDLAGQAKAAKVDTMDAQQAGTLRQEGLHRRGEGGHRGEVAEDPQGGRQLQGVRQGRRGQGRGQGPGHPGQGGPGQGHRGRHRGPPDQSKAVAKPVTPMAQEQPGQAVAIPAAGAVPKPAPAEQVNLAAGKHQANQEMADAEVTEPQLAQSNEPEFEQALADKKAAAAHADTAPGQFREHEKEVIQQGKADAAAETTAGVAGMQGAKGAALAKLVADKGKTKSKDEAKRAEVTAKIQGIFAATEADVKKILDGIDPKVEAAFEQGEAAARSAFETYVAAKMSAYKKDRYGGWLGGLRWAKDKLLGMPDEGQRVLRGRPRALPQADGRRHLAGRRHRRHRPGRGEEADRDRPGRDRVVRQEPARRPAEGRLRGVEGDRREVRAARERRQRQAGVGGRHASPRSTSRRARVSTSGSRSCRPRTRAWSTRRSARSRPSSTRSASSPRCSRTCSPGSPASSARSSRTRSASSAT